MLEFWGPQFKRNDCKLELVEKMVARMVRRVETIFCEEQLMVPDMLGMEKGG